MIDPPIPRCKDNEGRFRNSLAREERMHILRHCVLAFICKPCPGEQSAGCSCSAQWCILDVAPRTWHRLSIRSYWICGCAEWISALWFSHDFAAVLALGLFLLNSLHRSQHHMGLEQKFSFWFAEDTRVLSMLQIREEEAGLPSLVRNWLSVYNNRLAVPVPSGACGH